MNDGKMRRYLGIDERLERRCDMPAGGAWSGQRMRLLAVGWEKAKEVVGAAVTNCADEVGDRKRSFG